MRVRTVVCLVEELFPAFGSNPRPVSADTTLGEFSPVPLATPRPVTRMVRVWPARITGKVHSSVPPPEPTAGTVPQVASAGRVCER